MRKFRHKPTGEIAEQWETNSDLFHITNTGCTMLRKLLESGNDWIEIIERKPIATLQGKNLFIGDKYYTVTDLFKINEFIINEPDGTWYYQFDEESRSFHSKELAEDYIKENKPVYPYEMVKYLMERAEDVYRQPKNIYALRNMNDAVKQLKTYKPTS